MDPPPADEKNSNLQTQNNLLNSSEYTDEIKLMILEPAGIANCAEVGHVSNLELVCWKWHSLINDLFTVIHKSYYNDTFLRQLKENEHVKHLILWASPQELSTNNSFYNSYVKVIQEGLQNKPRLKTLTCNHNIIPSIFFNYVSGVNNMGMVMCRPGTPEKLFFNINIPSKYLELPHLACFLHLEQFLITGRIDKGRGNFDEYFINYFMTPQVLPNLKRFKCNEFDKIFS